MSVAPALSINATNASPYLSWWQPGGIMLSVAASQRRQSLSQSSRAGAGDPMSCCVCGVGVEG